MCVGEGWINWCFGLWKSQGFPHLNKILMCVVSPVFVFLVGWGGFCLDILEYGALSRKCQSSVYFRMPLQILKRASLARLRPVAYLSSAFTHRTNQHLPFQWKLLYSLSCLPQTQTVVVTTCSGALNSSIVFLIVQLSASGWVAESFSITGRS